MDIAKSRNFLLSEIKVNKPQNKIILDQGILFYKNNKFLPEYFFSNEYKTIPCQRFTTITKIYVREKDIDKIDLLKKAIENRGIKVKKKIQYGDLHLVISSKNVEDIHYKF